MHVGSVATPFFSSFFKGEGSFEKVFILKNLCDRFLIIENILQITSSKHF